jgi:type I restriction enzyme R subunit
MDKKKLSESDICDKYIRPAMVAAGWNGMDQLYQELRLRDQLEAILAQGLGGRA